MSEKPDDIPSEVWDYAEKAVFSRFPSASERIARAMAQARSQAFEEVLERLAKESKRYDRYDPHDTAYAVSQAIRQHSQKGER